MNEAGWVYFIRDAHGNTKIGMTSKPDPQERLAFYQTANPSPLTCELLILADDPPAFERFMHDRFESKHLRGEWFQLTNEDIESVRIGWSASLNTNEVITPAKVPGICSICYIDTPHGSLCDECAEALRQQALANLRIIRRTAMGAERKALSGTASTAQLEAIKRAMEHTAMQMRGLVERLHLKES